MSWIQGKTHLLSYCAGKHSRLLEGFPLTRDSNLTSSANYTEGATDILELEKIRRFTARTGTKWRFAPSGAQWRDGLSESRVKMLKATLEHFFSGGDYTKYEDFKGKYTHRMKFDNMQFGSWQRKWFSQVLDLFLSLWYRISELHVRVEHQDPDSTHLSPTCRHSCQAG